MKTISFYTFFLIFLCSASSISQLAGLEEIEDKRDEDGEEEYEYTTLRGEEEEEGKKKQIGLVLKAASVFILIYIFKKIYPFYENYDLLYRHYFITKKNGDARALEVKNTVDQLIREGQQEVTSFVDSDRRYFACLDLPILLQARSDRESYPKLWFPLFEIIQERIKLKKISFCFSKVSNDQQQQLKEIQELFLDNLEAREKYAEYIAQLESEWENACEEREEADQRLSMQFTDVTESFPYYAVVGSRVKVAAIGDPKTPVYIFKYGAIDINDSVASTEAAEILQDKDERLIYNEDCERRYIQGVASASSSSKTTDMQKSGSEESK